MKTARQHNQSQSNPVGEYEFIPNINSVHIVGGDSHANQVLTELFKACGWKVKTVKSVKPRKSK
jgi:hypothetical protein